MPGPFDDTSDLADLRLVVDANAMAGAITIVRPLGAERLPMVLLRVNALPKGVRGDAVTQAPVEEMKLVLDHEQARELAQRLLAAASPETGSP